MATEQSAIGSWDTFESQAGTFQWGDTMDFFENPCSLDGTISSVLFSEPGPTHAAPRDKAEGVDWNDVPFSPSAGTQSYGVGDPSM